MKKFALLFAVFAGMMFCAFNVQAQYGTITSLLPANNGVIRSEGTWVDGAGNLYVVDGATYKIYKLSASTGSFTCIAGNGTDGYTGDGGPAVVAEISWAKGLCTDASNNVFFADAWNNVIRKINTTTGIISTVAGGGSSAADGVPATTAQLSSPNGVFADASGNIYFTTGNKIRKVTVSTGLISTVAGTGTSGYSGDGGPATAAELSSPYSMVVDATGNVYISDNANVAGSYSGRIRKVNTSGTISTIAGNGTPPYSSWYPASGYDGGIYTGDGGPATAAQLNKPKAIGIDASGNVYFADGNNSVIRKVDVTTGMITKVAGTLNDIGFGGSGNAADSTNIGAEFMYIDNAGNIYYSNYDVNVFKITGVGSAIASLSATDSLGSASCTLPANINFGIYGTVSGIPAISSSVTVSVDFRDGTPIANYTIPYWQTSVYGFGSIYNSLCSHTYKYPGYYTPTISMVASGYSDVIYSPQFLIGNTCDTSVTGISITNATDSIVSFPCVSPVNVRFTVNGTITGSPTATDSAYIVIQYSDDSIDVHTAPYTLVGSTYSFNYTGYHLYTASSTYIPKIMAITSSGMHNATVSAPTPAVLYLYNCNGGSLSSSVSDSAAHPTYCSLPFTDRYKITGNLSDSATISDSVHVYVDFGDGTDTTMIIPDTTTGQGTFNYGTGYFYHTYTLPGAYAASVTATAGTYSHGSSSTLRTLGTSCSPVSGIFYIDANSNCTYDPGERLLGYWPYTLVNNTLNDSITGWCNDSGYYDLELINGDNYTLIADPFGNYGTGIGQNTVNISCPATGIYTVTATSGASYTQNFAFSCSPPSQLDMTIAGWGWGFVPGDTGVIGMWSSDYWGYMCDSLSSTITLTMDPLLTYAGMWDGPAPSNITGNTLTWTFSTQDNLFDFYADVKAVCNTSAMLGSNVCNTLYVSPTALTDPNLSNNTYAWCEPVSSSWDPNEKQVSPVGVGQQGYIADGTPLSYLIHFQNTGTAMAKNITISDTINGNMDISTLQVLNSSVPVLVYQMPGNIIDFKFNNINLPDSISDPRGSIGYIAYNIMPNDGLAPGTQITNNAAIYFDYNPAVITNATLNTIDTVASTDTTTGIQNLSNGCYIYPNPANDVLTIKIDKGQYNVFTIVNNVGEVVTKQPLNNYQTNVDVKMLPAGMYYISLKGDNGVVVRKFVKL